jgi:hypothetical protein
MKYTIELANKICEQVAKMVPIRKIAALPDMPSKATILRWRKTITDFQKQYDGARDKAFADWNKEQSEFWTARRLERKAQEDIDQDVYDAYLQLLANRKALALIEKPVLEAAQELAKRKPYQYFSYLIPL